MKTLILFFIVSVFINENSHLPSHIFLSKKDIHVYTLIIDSIDKLNKEKERFALAKKMADRNTAITTTWITGKVIGSAVLFMICLLIRLVF